MHRNRTSFAPLPVDIRYMCVYMHVYTCTPVLVHECGFVCVPGEGGPCCTPVSPVSGDEEGKRWRGGGGGVQGSTPQEGTLTILHIFVHQFG